MTPKYTYTPSPYFINNLIFDCIETYSFQRGQAFEENNNLMQAEYERLKTRKEELNNLSDEEEERFLGLYRLLDFTQYITDDNGQFHPSCKRTNIFKQNDPNIDRIKTILQTEINQIPGWLCAPEYRDALVFYNGNEIVATLNICLSCQYMETTKFNYINGDYKTYDLLKRFFIDIGHEIEDTEEAH